ncbi:hypothetical protein TanjilG_12734 [Lupinus angustifolius]|uniref:Hydroquinone glucosyltransferase n=1 Tax=Lupinus angustifolius TaxID=3871 RepID=A0A1J7GHW6_LUPAN|nr:hypothetical protein TanjilG_12734 [Lupinus angustifolius]
METKITHIAVVSIPAFSHQASIVEFCKRLVHFHHNFHVTCIFTTIDSPPQATITFLQSLPPNIDYIFLPPINKQDLPKGVPLSLQISHAVSQSLPSFHHALQSLCSSNNPLVALIADPFANETLEIAKEFNLLSYIYFPPSAMTLSLFLHLPTLHEEVSCEYKDYKEAIHIPGCLPIHGNDLPEHLQDRSSLSYELILERCKRFSLAHGFLVNSFSEIEGVPMITWPLFAEQRMNAVLLTKGLKVALRPKFNDNDIAEKKEIAEVIKELMLGEEGHGISQRIEELKYVALSALKEDGSSTRALSQFITDIENFLRHKV